MKPNAGMTPFSFLCFMKVYMQMLDDITIYSIILRLYFLHVLGFNSAKFKLMI